MKLKKDTICVQGGWQPKNGEPRVLPIYQSTTFRYETRENCLIWRKKVTFIPVCRIRPAIL